MQQALRKKKSEYADVFALNSVFELTQFVQFIELKKKSFCQDRIDFLLSWKTSHPI